MDEKAMLKLYLQRERDALLWKTEGLSERELRMPRTRTGSNLLGILKHVATVDVGYFGLCSAGPFPSRCRGARTTLRTTPTCGPPPTSRRHG